MTKVRLEGVGFRVEGLELRAEGVGFRAEGVEFTPCLICAHRTSHQ